MVDPVDPIDDIAQQARQGSVAAIIQVLNEKLAGSGVRTRAFFEDGVLQLLCEAAQEQQLDQATLVPKVKQILESLSPRNIRHVNINSRIVQEQQLLWLKEIHRHPEAQLWSEEVTLARPHLLKQIVTDLKQKQLAAARDTLPRATSLRQMREQRQFRRGILGGTILSLLLVGAIVGYNWLTSQGRRAEVADSPTPTTVPSSPAATIDPTPVPSSVPSPNQVTSNLDPFGEAVRLAEQAAIAGRTAQSSADWLALATQWQQASDLMAKVPSQDTRYSTAQDRINLYVKFSEAALQEANRVRTQ